MNHRRQTGFALLAATLAAPLVSQNSTAEVIDRIRDEGLNRSQVMEYAWQLSDGIGPRLAGSTNLQKAEIWAKQAMDLMGLSGTAIEAYADSGVRWDVSYVSLHMLEPDYQPLIGYPLAFSPGTDGVLNTEAQLVVIRTEDDLAQHKGKLRGAIILTTLPRQLGPRFEPQAIRHDEASIEVFENAGTDLNMANRRTEPWYINPPRVLSGSALAEFYQEEGVALVIEGVRGGDGTVFITGNRGRSVAQVEAATPTVAIAPEHYNRLYRLLERGRTVVVEAEVRVDIQGDLTEAHNVIGEIAGSDLSDELVMVGGHLDSWHTGTGATDNAAGSAIALEAMRILRAVGAEPRRTIRVGLWSNEEFGLIGSRNHVAKHFGNPTDGIKPAYDKFSVYFNTDNGTGQARGVHMQGNEAVGEIFTSWMRPFNDLGVQTLSRFSNTGTDHLQFDRAGLPGFQLLQDRIEYRTRTHHTNMDVYDKLIARDLQISAVVMAGLAYQAAMADERLPRKPFTPRQR